MRHVLLMIFSGFFVTSFAQVKDINKNLNPSLTLKISGTEGANGGAVAWSPITHTYYAAIAGNTEFPMTVFDEKGKEIQTTITNADVRGMWYNPFYEFIEANIYEYHDVISYGTDEKTGEIVEEEPYEEIYELPILEPNAVVALDTEDELYIWFDSEVGKVYTIDAETGEEVSDMELNIPVDLANINYTSVIYTDVEDAEYGLLNFTDKLIYLFNKSNGELTATLKLPSNASTKEQFNFAYANGYIWLFDMEKREWNGYYIWK
jgi:hypothetical protein